MDRALTDSKVKTKEEDELASTLDDKEKLREFDPIPPSIKKDFFADKSPPNLSKDYDVIGFDMDHCLIKYKLGPFYSLMCRIFIEELNENFGYPKEILEFDLSEYSDDIKLATNNSSIMDFDTGCIIKLGPEKEILAAIKGRTVLT